MKTVYLDTSSLNWICDDPDKTILIDKILERCQVNISVFNIAELSATSDNNRRKELLNVAKDLTGSTHPLAMPGDLLKRTYRSVIDGEVTIKATIDEEWMGVWNALQNPDSIDEQSNKDIKRWKRAEEEWYKKLINNLRDDVMKEIEGLTSPQKRLLLSRSSAFLKHYSNNEPLLLDMVVGV